MNQVQISTIKCCDIRKSERGSCRFIFLILAVYTASLILPVENADDFFLGKSSGAAVLIDCLTDRMYPLFTWIAVSPNFIFFAGIILLAKRSWLGSKACGFFSLTGALLVIILVHLNQSDILRNLASGFYCWISSMVLLVLGSTLRLR